MRGERDYDAVLAALEDRYEDIVKDYIEHLKQDAEYNRTRLEDLQHYIRSREETEEAEAKIFRPLPSAARGSMPPSVRRKKLEQLHRKLARERQEAQVPTVEIKGND